MTNNHNMQPKIKQTCAGLLLVILLVYSFTVQAARLNQCNGSMLASETQQISFGDMAPTVGGTVTVSTAGARTATGVSLLGGSVNAGILTVTSPLANCHCYPLRITVRDATATLASGGNSMAMSNIVTSPTTADAATVGSAAGSSLQINVGADLAVGAAQAAGTYNTAGDTYMVRVRFLRSPTSGNKCP